MGFQGFSVDFPRSSKNIFRLRALVYGSTRDDSPLTDISTTGGSEPLVILTEMSKDI